MATVAQHVLGFILQARQNMSAIEQPRPANSVLRGLVLAMTTVLLLLPFVYKPFHLDDTVFLRIAQKILEQPLEPYNFVYCWNADYRSMWLQTMHPPLYSYLLAAVGASVGFSELAMHVTGLFFAGGCAWLMHRLAIRFCAFPVTATLIAVVTPAFLVSATTVMTDVPLLFFWLLAVHETVRAIDSGTLGRLWLAGLAAAAAAMIKYFGIALVPLLMVYWYVAKRGKYNQTGRVSVDVLALWLPVLVLIAWSAYSHEELGQFHILAAASFASREKTGTDVVVNVLQIIPYLGATILWPCCLLVMLRQVALGWRLLLAAAVVAGGAVYALVYQPAMPAIYQLINGVFYSVMAATGILVLLVCVDSCMKRRDTDTLLLGLWTFGTLFFAAVVNWTFNARVLLPAIFPATLLIVRWIAIQPRPGQWMRCVRFAIVPTALVTLAVAFTDYQYAVQTRDFVQSTIQPKIDNGTHVYFTGHWGLQWYLEEAGAVPLDASEVAINPGDILVEKSGTDNYYPEHPLELTDEEKRFSSLGLHTLDSSSYGHFYDGVEGGLPFALTPDFVLERFRQYRFLPL